ncbi:hypothetical protein C9374_010140 [Naegleria lovaniensis]|uniref:DDE Tnp4 domain-containing protein n=1 Tax=Naegleria lovaniensis TaxID=51637 RepID=A0AA88GJ64_NAELO|nr:uncharacterized protein C9374_010140 [Naegleria lovaniensis]KAG2375136.1 hypothetical protein C9374_010140 [Naegleria lovaniensis]
MQRNELQNKVLSKISKKTLETLNDEINKKKLPLWGLAKDQNFENDCLLIALYHDLFGVGYHKIESEVLSFLKISAKSIRHNTKIIRQSIQDWCDAQIVLGSCSDWNQAAQMLGKTEKKIEINLWINSSDFKKTQPENASKKSDEYSYKEDHFANRFTCFSDANGRIRKLYGAYSPKVEDSAFMTLMKDEIETSMEGAVMLGDCGYESVVSKFRKINIVTPKSKQKDGRGIRKLTQKQKARNKLLKSIRSRVECPLGDIKLTWKSLSSCFTEDDTQHSYVVKMAVAIRNFQIKE